MRRCEDAVDESFHGANTLDTTEEAANVSEKIIDLTHTMFDDMPVFPGDPPFSLKTYHTIESAGFNLTQVMMSTHVGTHLDAPLHFIRDGKTTDTMDLSRCVGEAHLLDLTHRGAPLDEMTIDDFKRYDDVIRKGARLIVRTGWDRVFPSPEFFTEMPGISIDAATFLAEREIALIGLDLPSVHVKESQRVHEILLEAEIVIVEGLTNLAAIERSPFYFVALPLKFAGRDGSPVRAVAIER